MAVFYFSKCIAYPYDPILQFLLLNVFSFLWSKYILQQLTVKQKKIY